MTESKRPQSLPEFLLERIAEDESEAQATSGRIARAAMQEMAAWAGGVGPAARHIARWDPARVLAECQARRQIVEFAQEATGMEISLDLEFGQSHRDEAADPYIGDRILHLLAAPYAGHPDYRPEWKL
jgi:hypothetical protein